MLSKSHRLPKELFSKVFEQGFTVRSGNLMCKALKDPEMKGLFAISISKKEAKTAVDRNRIRRRVYSAIQKGFSSGKKEKTTSFDEIPFGVIFFVRKNILSCSFKDLCVEVVSIMSKIR